jgi:hypothetical protein
LRDFIGWVIASVLEVMMLRGGDRSGIYALSVPTYLLIATIALINIHVMRCSVGQLSSLINGLFVIGQPERLGVVGEAPVIRKQMFFHEPERK